MQGKNKGVAYLLCPTPGCSAGAKFDLVEQAVLLQLQELARGLEISLSRQAPPDTAVLEKELAQTREQLGRLDSRRDRLYTFLEDGTYTREVFAQRMAVLSGDEERLRGRIEELEGKIRAELGRDKRKQLERLKDVLANYQEASLAGKKDLLRSIVAVIYYTKRKKTKPGDFSVNVILREDLE